ncbi:hypothetical protein DMB42_22125 [Nonomuraea sp. WAC 01424]|nr:hypothetical protein DMB42_22125 [Nonomuraea sp. WAC 01424]
MVHLGASDHQLVSAALTAGCLPVAVFTDAARAGVIWTRLARTHPGHDLEVTDLRITDLDDDEVPLADVAGSAGLVVTEQTCERPGRHPAHQDVHPAAKAFGIMSAAGLVKPGGHLAVVTGLRRQGAVVDPLPEIIGQARSAGLVYLQHIIALRHPARGDHIEPDLSRRGMDTLRELPQCDGLSTSARVHSDVLLFTRPRGLPLSDEPEAPPAGDDGPPAASRAATPVGGGR